jgi:hypothetical protein
LGQGIITGSISGSVEDSSGAALPTAKVALKNLTQGTVTNVPVQGDGNFYLRAVPIGSYSLTISADNFQPVEIPVVTVNAGVDAAIGRKQLKAGASTTVTVEGASSVELDTTQSQVSASFSSEDLQRLPLAGGFDEVAVLIPGVAQTHADNFSNTNGPNFSSNGERGRSNNFEIDGQSNNDNSVGGPQLFFGNQDAIAEIQVIQSNFGAQYGRNTGTVVNYITKSGTNDIHGSAFEFYTGSFLSSLANQYKTPLFGYCAPGESAATTGCAPVVKPRTVDNRWGATVGVPIIKDKLWAFGSTYFEHTNVGSVPANSGSEITPTPNGLAQLQADFPGNPAVAGLVNFGPYGVKFGNPQPVGTPTTLPVTLPNGNSATVEASAVSRNAPQSGDYTDQEDLGRLDWQATSRDRFYLRYYYQTTLNTNLQDANNGDFYDIPATTYSVGSDITHTFSASWLDQLRYSFQQSKLDFQAGSYPGCTVNTLTACPGQISFQDGVSEGFGQANNLPQGRTVKVTQVQDNASWTHGSQTILFGGEYDRQNSPNVYLPNYNGSGTFANLDAYIHQNGSFSIADGNPVLPFIENDWAVYFQDDWKATPNLTLNMGLRWEFFGQAVNLLHDETVARESNPATAIWDQTLPLSQRTVAKAQNAYKNFQPRLGFSFNPDFAKKMVIRGGYSIGFDPSFYNIFLNIATLAPVANAATFPCNGTCLGTGDLSGAGLRATNLASLPTGLNPNAGSQQLVPTNFHNPYAQTYSLGIEYQLSSRILGSARYVGNHTTGNFQTLNVNPYLAPVAAAFPSFATGSLCTTPGAIGLGTPNCNLGTTSSVANTSFSVYNGLQTQLTFRGFYGFTGNASYTFSRTVDNTSEIFGTGAGGNTIAVSQNPLDSNIAERGVSGNSYPNVVSAELVYKVPEMKLGSSLLTKAANGFNINSILQYNGGQPYNPTQPILPLYGLDSSYCDANFALNFVGVDSCRLILSNKSAPLNSVAIINGGSGPYELNSYLTGANTPISLSDAHWLINNSDSANLANNPFPGSGRNILRGPSFLQLDSSIYKDTKITERVNLELQLNAYNVLNHQYLGSPNVNSFATNPGATVNPFLSTAYNGASLAPGSNGVRAFTLGAKVQF